MRGFRARGFLLSPRTQVFSSGPTSVNSSRALSHTSKKSTITRWSIALFNCLSSNSLCLWMACLKKRHRGWDGARNCARATKQCVSWRSTNKQSQSLHAVCSYCTRCLHKISKSTPMVRLKIALNIISFPRVLTMRELTRKKSSTSWWAQTRCRLAGSFKKEACQLAKSIWMALSTTARHLKTKAILTTTRSPRPLSIRVQGSREWSLKTTVRKMMKRKQEQKTYK